MTDLDASRRAFLEQLSALGFTFVAGKNAPADAEKTGDPGAITPEMIAAVEKIQGLTFSDGERAMLVPELTEARAGFLRLRETALPNEVPPAFVFDPRAIVRERERERARAGSDGAEAFAKRHAAALRAAVSGAPKRPAEAQDVHFAPIMHLAAWIRRGELTSVELTRLTLERLKSLDKTLHFVVNLREESALADAARADGEIAAKVDRGPLHGIPWGAKDIIAARGSKTTWGAKGLENQVIDRDADVVSLLAARGAVLAAKLTTGALAMGDRWFGGMTRNPWNPERGSSGSSAGPASAAAAGAVPFAIGSETLGSIISPCTQCGATGLRPTFGRVSANGAMTLSWTMDKLGPIGRDADDLSLVFDAIRETEAGERGDVAPDFAIAGKRIGVIKDRAASRRVNREIAACRAVFESLGAVITEIDPPSPSARDLLTILTAEASSAFDDFLLTGHAKELLDQGPNDWPNTFRAGRFIPAVEYLRAMRRRRDLCLAMEDYYGAVDALLTTPFEADILGRTNLSGHPAVVFPIGFRNEKQPVTATLTGKLGSDESLLLIAAAFQRATDWNRRRPPL